MHKLLLTIIATILCTATYAQRKEVQNKPYIDLRPMHFGVLVGFHTEDMELQNIGTQFIPQEDGTTKELLISGEQDTWDFGFTVGVLAEGRINSNLALRLAPTMYFGNRHVQFLNHTDKLADGTMVRENQDLKSVYIATTAELIFAAQRLNNARPYLVAGLSPMLNLANKSNGILKLKPFETYLSIGMGCDFYLPFFKLRPELKFMYSLTDALDKKHIDKIQDKNLKNYATAINSAHTKMIALTFYFE